MPDQNKGYVNYKRLAFFDFIQKIILIIELRAEGRLVSRDDVNWCSPVMIVNDY